MDQKPRSIDWIWLGDMAMDTTIPSEWKAFLLTEDHN